MVLLAGSRSLWLTTLMIIVCIITIFYPNLSSQPSIVSLYSDDDDAINSEFENDIITAHVPAAVYVPPPPAAAPENEFWEHLPSNLDPNLPSSDLYEKGPDPAIIKPYLEKNCPKLDIEKDCPKFDFSTCPKTECPPCEDCKSIADLMKDQQGLVKTPKEDRPLVTYVYSESDFARINLKFFVEHGLHGGADFLFILNGETDVEETIIKPGIEQVRVGLRKRLQTGDNIRVKHRENTCFDLGAHGEVLMEDGGGEGLGVDGVGRIAAGSLGDGFPKAEDVDRPAGKARLMDRYKKFILMNASIRGPFLPYWSGDCWSDRYLAKLNDKVKLVGSTYNCHEMIGPGHGHVQSMIWAVDSIGLHLLLQPNAIGQCFSALSDAMEVEIGVTPYFREKGFEVDVLMAAYHSTDKIFKPRTSRHNKRNSELQEQDIVSMAKREADDAQLPWHVTCEATENDFNYHHSYYGFNVHPYETMFLKSHRAIDDNMLEKMSLWSDGEGYSSWDVCF